MSLSLPLILWLIGHSKQPPWQLWGMLLSFLSHLLFVWQIKGYGQLMSYCLKVVYSSFIVVITTVSKKKQLHVYFSGIVVWTPVGIGNEKGFKCSWCINKFTVGTLPSHLYCPSSQVLWAYCWAGWVSDCSSLLASSALITVHSLLLS